MSDHAYWMRFFALLDSIVEYQQFLADTQDIFIKEEIK